MYYRIDSEDIEPISQGNGQHSHEPLWKRNDPERIRHIRGILIDDDPETRKVFEILLINVKNTTKGRIHTEQVIKKTMKKEREIYAQCLYSLLLLHIL